MLTGIVGKVILELECIVGQLVAGCERLKARRHVVLTVALNFNQREEFTTRAAVFVLVSVTNNQVIRHFATNHCVPLTDDRANIFVLDVVGVLEAKCIGTSTVAKTQRSTCAYRYVARRIQHRITKVDLVIFVDVEIEAGRKLFTRSLQIVAFVRACLIAELIAQVVAESIEISCRNAGNVTAGCFTAVSDTQER